MSVEFEIVLMFESHPGCKRCEQQHDDPDHLAHDKTTRPFLLNLFPGSAFTRQRV